MPNDQASFDAAFDRLVAEALPTHEMPGEDVNLFEAGLSSIEFVNLLMAMEDEFGGFWPVERLSSYADLGRVGALRSAARDQVWRSRRAAARPPGESPEE